MTIATTTTLQMPTRWGPWDDAGQTDELITFARQLRGRLLERAPQVERDRRLPNETIAELQEAGFFRYIVPTRCGGMGGSLIGQIEIAAELARGCPSTAWVFTLITYVNGFAASYLPKQGATEIYGSIDPVMACGANGFTGTARRSGDGYIVSGKWAWCSGSWHANWGMGGILILNDEDEVVDRGWAFFPMSSVTLEDVWYVAGMRGTGSNTLVADGIHIPAHLVMLMDDRLAHEANPQPGDEPMDRMPFASVFGLALMGTCLGAAEVVYDMVSANMKKKGVTYFSFDRQVDSGAAMEQLGEARMKIDTAWLHVRRGARVVNDDTIDGPLDYKTRARCRADSAHAASVLRSAVDTLLNISGSSSFAEGSAIQRFWRDLNVSSRHAFLNTAPVYEAFSRAELGLESNITPYI